MKIMEQCPQCRKKLEAPANRLVQDSCGHKKCRVCLLGDEIKCLQCSQENITINENNTSIINCHTPVITFQSQKCVVSEDSLKINDSLVLSNESLYSCETAVESKHTTVPCDKKSSEYVRKTEIRATKRTYKSLSIPSYVSVSENPLSYKCNICMKSFNTKWHIKYHQYCNGGKKPLKCEVCLKEFITKTHLEAHLVTHTGTRQHSCDVCKKSFSQKSKLVRHKLLHSETKPFACEECGKSFKSKESLRLHISIHKGEKPFKCNQCEAKFNNSSNLKKHIVTHSKEKSHMCDQCGKRFKLKWALTVHHRSHTRLRPHECANCSKTFINAKDLHRHELIHSDLKAYNCGVCGTGFRRKDNLERHMKNTHPGKNVPPIKNVKPKIDAQKQVSKHIVENPNAIKVITAPPTMDVKTLSSKATSVINGPLKLAFKTSAFKNYYNIHRNYEPPSDDRESISVYQKILQPHSPAVVKRVDKISEQDSNEICKKILLPFSRTPPANYETSFEHSSHAVIKNIKFKLPANYMNIKTVQGFQDIVPLQPVVNDVEEMPIGDGTYTELRSAKTSVIVNSSANDIHWRRRTSQHLNLNGKQEDT